MPEPDDPTPKPPTRREQVRQELVAQTMAAARGLLAADGVDGVTMSAVARAVGIVTPGLYRYFKGRSDLIGALYDDVLEELSEYDRAAILRQDPDDVAAQVHAGVRAIFTWCRAHPHEVDLLMGSAYRNVVRDTENVRTSITQHWGGKWATTLEALWHAGASYATDDQIPAALRPRLVAYREMILRERPDISPDLPLGTVYALHTGWRQLYGLICMMTYGHQDFLFDDYEEVFDDLTDHILKAFGVRRSPNVRLDEPPVDAEHSVEG